MFDIRSAGKAAARAAPAYLVTRIPTVMAGAATCYLSLLFLIGPVSFVRTIWALAMVVGVCYAVHVGSGKATDEGARRVLRWLNNTLEKQHSSCRAMCEDVSTGDASGGGGGVKLAGGAPGVWQAADPNKLD